MDRLERLTLHSGHGDNRSVIQAHDDKRHARQKRAVRWFGRAVALGAAITMSVLTGGKMAPVGVSLIGVVEGVCQLDKGREVAKKEGNRI